MDRIKCRADDVLFFRIEMLDGDRIRVISQDGKKRGWVTVAQVVALAKALEPLGAMIQANPTCACARLVRADLCGQAGVGPGPGRSR